MGDDVWQGKATDLTYHPIDADCRLDDKILFSVGPTEFNNSVVAVVGDGVLVRIALGVRFYKHVHLVVDRIVAERLSLAGRASKRFGGSIVRPRWAVVGREILVPIMRRSVIHLVGNVSTHRAPSALSNLVRHPKIAGAIIFPSPRE